MSKGKQMRISRRVQKAITAAAGRIQDETGENISAEKAIFEVIRRVFPDITARYESMEENGDNGDNGDDDE